jgi:hypothetical protein
MSYINKLHGNVRILLFALIVLHFAYPFSELSDTASAIYVTTYCLMIGTGIYVTTTNRRRVIIGTILNIATIITGVIWALTSNDRELNTFLFIFYGVIISNTSLISWTVLEYIFRAREVTGSVLSAGLTFYMLIGNIFTPLYFLLNALVKIATGADAFIVNTQNIQLTWQRMYYFSFTTLTTLGYGDITPVSPYVEPFVTAEAIIGVLYTAVLMARLVSLYERKD